MGFLDRLRSSQNHSIKKGWKVLNNLDQIQEIIDHSHTRPAVIFKHSTSCGISAMMHSQVESDWNLDAEQVDFYYLDLLSYRNVSNKVAERLNVVHQSPQIILINQGKAVYDASHHAINVDKIRQLLKV